MRRWIEAWFPSQHHWPLTEGPLSKFDQPNLWCHLILIWLFFWLMPNKWILYIQLQIVNRIQNLREKVAQPTDTRGGGLLWIFFGWRQVDLATSFEFTSNIINFVILFPPVTFSSKAPFVCRKVVFFWKVNSGESEFRESIFRCLVV
jgi:hypothetical protein